MKKRIYILLLAAMVLLVGCGSVKKAGASSVYIDKKGKVTSVLVESFAAEQYDETELEEFIRSSIDQYNDENDKKSVSLDSYTVKKGQVRVILEYASCEDYENFNQTTLFSGSIKEAKAAGYDFKGNFASSSGDAADGSKILETNPEAKVIILNELIQVMTARNILYVSENAEIMGPTLAKVLPDEREENENAQIMTADYAYIIYE